MTNFIIDKQDLGRDFSIEALLQMTNNTDTAVIIYDGPEESMMIMDGKILDIHNQ